MKILDVLKNIEYKEIINELDIEFNDVSINSKESGEMFIGLKGANKDGSIYFIDALVKGAKIAVINDICISNEDLEYIKENDKMVIIVSDTLLFLQDIARYKRSLYNIPVIAITGSAGKTSTKDLVYNVVKQKYNTLRTLGNYNNHIGVPLTILNLRNHEALVIEMGMEHFGEISLLSDIAKPTLAIITNIGTCHMELVGGLEGVLKAKLEILDGMENKKLIINNDDKLLSKYGLTNEVITYGIYNKSDEMLEIIEENPYYSKISYNNEVITIPKGGLPFIYNTLCAITVGNYLNIDFELIKMGIENTEFTKGRSEIINANGYEIISDCYNANLEAMEHSINFLGLFKTRKIAVLGTVGQLGDYAAEGHGNLGHTIYNNNIDILVTVGRDTININKVAISDGFAEENAYHFDNLENTIDFLKGILKENDTILVKASHFNNFDKIINEIIK